MIKMVLIAAGTLSLVLGIVGIFVPVLPTTPFLLLTAGLYLRSSERLYHAVLRNKIMGGYISRYRNNGGMTIKSKTISIILMWAMIFLSGFFFVHDLKIHILLLVLGVIGTLVMGKVVPTAKNNNNIDV